MAKTVKENEKKSKGHVLLIDSDPGSESLFKEVCDETGLSLVTVKNKDSGIAALKSDSIELVFADVDFHELPGFVLLKEINKKKIDISIVIISSNQEDTLRALRYGAVDFLQRPLYKSEVTGRIKALLQKKKKSKTSSMSARKKSDINSLDSENKELNDLLKISSSIDVFEDSKIMLQRMADLSAESMNCEAASILLKNDRANLLEFVVASGEKGNRLETMSVPIGEGIAGWVALYGKPQIVNDTLKDSRFTGKVDDESGFITRQILAAPMYLDGEIIGVLEVINTKDNRTFGNDDLRKLGDVSDRAAKVIGTTQKIESQQNFYIQITNIIVRAIEKKDMFNEGHGWQVAELCHKIGRALSLSENEMNDLHFGALLHDIGKLDMPCTLLNKRNVSEREMEYLRQHPVKGAKLIEPINIWKTVVPCILYHHENWDGSGYPFSRSDESIPLLARIVCLAEAFSVMRAPNSYKRQMTLKESILEIMRSAGKQFDPEVVKVFIKVLEEEAAVRRT